MPIGKSAIKRVSSAGYANLKNEAPDMENSVVAEEKSAPVQNKTATKPTAKKPAAKKAEAKPAAKKAQAKPAAKKAEAKPTAKKAEAKPTAKKAEAKPTAKKTEAKPTAKKTEAKPAVKKPAKAEEKAEVKASVLPRGAETAVMITESFKANEPESKGYYNLGDDMPAYLL